MNQRYILTIEDTETNKQVSITMDDLDLITKKRKPFDSPLETVIKRLKEVK